MRGSASVGRADVAGVALIVAVASMIASVSLRYPFTIQGVDARQRDMAFALALSLVAAGWWRRARTPGPVWSFVASSAVLSVPLVAMSWIVGYGPFGPLATAWWIEKVIGALMLGSCVAGLVSARRSA